MLWYGPSSERVWMQRRKKNWLKYTDFTEPKKITRRIYSNCSNYSSLFFKPTKFHCFPFCFIKNKFRVNCTSVLLILLFIHSTFFKGKEKSGIFVGFHWFFKRFFLTGWHFLVGSNCVSPDDNYGRLIDFLNQISKFSYLNAVDLSDFMMHQ